MKSKFAIELNEEFPVHWFTSSFLNWNCGDNLEQVLRRQRRADNQGSMKPQGFNLYRVPGADEDSNYKIRNYAPDVEGAEWIAYIEYPEPKK